MTLLATTAACAGGGSSGNDTSGTTTVKVAHVPSTLFAPLYVAQEKGYFEQQGLKVELEKVKAGQDAVPLAASGKVDVVAAGFSAGLFNGVAKGLKVKVAASMGASTGADPSPTALEVAKRLMVSNEIQRPEDLRGRKVAVAGGAGAAGGYQLEATLRQGGLGLKDVTVVNVPIPDIKNALANGGVDAGIVPAPFTTAMEKAGVAQALSVPPRGTTASGIVFGSGFDGEPQARKFLEALRKGAADLQGDGAADEKNLAILAKATGQDIDVLRATPPYEWDPALAPNTAQLAKQQQTYRDAGLLDGAPVTDNHLLAESARER
ncbi:ABC transporter substrate-binding protein [Streptomyces sp. NPDC055709]